MGGGGYMISGGQISKTHERNTKGPGIINHEDRHTYRQIRNIHPMSGKQNAYKYTIIQV